MTNQPSIIAASIYMHWSILMLVSKYNLYMIIKKASRPDTLLVVLDTRAATQNSTGLCRLSVHNAITGIVPSHQWEQDSSCLYRIPICTTETIMSTRAPDWQWNNLLQWKLNQLCPVFIKLFHKHPKGCLRTV